MTKQGSDGNDEGVAGFMEIGWFEGVTLLQLKRHSVSESLLVAREIERIWVGNNHEYGYQN